MAISIFAFIHIALEMTSTLQTRPTPLGFFDDLGGQMTNFVGFVSDIKSELRSLQKALAEMSPLQARNLVCSWIGSLLADPKFSTNDSFWKDIDNLTKQNKLDERVLNNLKIKHGPNAARSLPKFDKMTLQKAELTLKSSGFFHNGKTNGGYDQWRSGPALSRVKK